MLKNIKNTDNFLATLELYKIISLVFYKILKKNIIPEGINPNRNQNPYQKYHKEN
jgi:hypothetical protein